MKAASATVGLVHVVVVAMITTGAILTTCCTGDQTLSTCTSSEQCNLSPNGQCLPSPLGVNLCAYPDEKCENTSLSWGQLSGELSGQCVIDHTAPTIVATSPANADADVGTAINITVEFSEPIDPATLTASTFVVTQSGSPVEGTLSTSANTAVFQSTVRLAPNAAYSVNVTTDITDRAGNKLAEGATWSFATRSGGWKDPTLLKTDAAASAHDLITDVDAAGHAAAVWLMHPCSTGQVCDTGAANLWASAYINGSWSTPALIPTSTYITLPSVAVDGSGNAVAVWFDFGTATSTISSLVASRYSVGSGWSAPVTVGQNIGGLDTRPSIDAAPNGDVIVVWQQRSTPKDLWWAKMSALGSWAAPVRLENGPEAAYAPVVGFSPNGSAAAVWEQPLGSVHASRYSAGAFGQPVSLQNISSGYGIVRAGADGALHTLWFSAADVWWVQYTQAWSTPTTIDASSESVYFSTDLTFDASGQGIAVWSQGAPAQQSAYYAVYEPNSGWSAPKTLESNVGTAGDVHIAYGRSLAAMATWIQPSGSSSYSVWSSVRNNSTNKWSVPELVETDDSGDSSRPSVFFDPTDNAFHAIWLQQTTGKFVSVYSGSFE